MQISTVAQPASTASADAKANSTSGEAQSGTGDFASLLFSQAFGKPDSSGIGGETAGAESGMGKGNRQPSAKQQETAAQTLLQMMGLPVLTQVLPANGAAASPETAAVSGSGMPTATEQTGCALAGRAADMPASETIFAAALTGSLTQKKLTAPTETADAQAAASASNAQPLTQKETGAAVADAGFLSGQTVTQAVQSSGTALSSMNSVERTAKQSNTTGTTGTVPPTGEIRAGTSSANTQTVGQRTASLAAPLAVLTSSTVLADTSLQGTVPNTVGIDPAAPLTRMSAAGDAPTTGRENMGNSTEKQTQGAVQTSPAPQAATTESLPVDAPKVFPQADVALPTSSVRDAQDPSSAVSTQMPTVLQSDFPEKTSTGTPSGKAELSARVQPTDLGTGMVVEAKKEATGSSGADSQSTGSSGGGSSQSNTGSPAGAAAQAFPSILSGQAVSKPLVQMQPAVQQQAVTTQVTDAVKDAYTAQRSELRVHLNPEDLGGITIKLVSQGGNLTVSIIADSHHTGQLLASGLDSLKSTLQNSGVPVQKTEVTYTPSDTAGQTPYPQHQTGQDSRQQGRHTSYRSQQETADSGEAPAAGFASLINRFA